MHNTPKLVADGIQQQKTTLGPVRVEQETGIKFSQAHQNLTIQDIKKFV